MAVSGAMNNNKNADKNIPIDSNTFLKLNKPLSITYFFKKIGIVCKATI